jgi:type III restriction enzyme
MFQDIDTSRITAIDAEIKTKPILNEIEQTALQQEQAYEETIAQLESTQSISLPSELQSLVKTYKLKEVFAEQASQIQLPQFFIRKPSGEIFNDEENLLSEVDLLEGFLLSKYDSNIAFDSVSSELYKVDLDESQSDYTPSFVKLDGGVKEHLMAYILDPSRKDSRIKNLTAQIMDIIGNMYPITEHEIKKYIHKILEDFTDEQFHDFLNHHYSYTSKIKEKIRSLSDAYAEKKFRDYLDTDKIFIKPNYSFAKEIAPGNTCKDITKSLYEKEAEMNSFEEKVINEIANIPSIAFWTRNISKKQFKINAFKNHYPDFIIQTKSGKTIVLESKGDDRDNSDSEAKIRLGKAWERKAGNNFKYFMVFDKKEVQDAHKLDEFLKLVKEM